jgi:hypothetical protein
MGRKRIGRQIGRAKAREHDPIEKELSLRAERSNPSSTMALDRFVASLLAMTILFGWAALGNLLTALDAGTGERL